jgi:hypothetical protein
MEKSNSNFKSSFVTVGGRPTQRLQQLDTTGEFSTPDLHQASFLLARGRRVTKVRQMAGGRCYFYFARTPALEEAVSEFHANAAIGIRDFIGATYAVKRMLREHSA